MEIITVEGHLRFFLQLIGVAGG